MLPCATLLNIFLVVLLSIGGLSCSKRDSNSPATAKLVLHTAQTDLVLGEHVIVTVKVSGNLTEPVLIKPNYEWNSPLLRCQSCEPQPLQWTTQTATFEWTCEEPGMMVLFFTVKQNPSDSERDLIKIIKNSTQFGSLSGVETTDDRREGDDKVFIDPAHLDIRGAFVQLQIGRSSLLHTISWAFGWCYFMAWVCSKYPQLIINFRRKSVVGLNFDFVGLNLVGFGGYTIFNVCITWVPMFRQAYEHMHPHSNIPVQINDVLFALHGVVATSVLAVQCCIYERGDQRISDRVQKIFISIFSPAIVLSILLVSTQLKPLAYIYFFSYVKMVLTVAKYVPQVIFNYRRKSTRGWSIYYIIFDLAGGTLSIGQMTCLAINFADPKYFTFNLAKLGIGLATLVFDTIFIIQHYWLYGDRQTLQDEERTSQVSTETNDCQSQLTNVDGAVVSEKSHHLPACRGCCMCINKNNILHHHHHHQQLSPLPLSLLSPPAPCAGALERNIGRALTVQFPRQTFPDEPCPLSLAKHLQLKVDPKCKQ